MKQYVQDTCEVICEDNGRKMVADILAFKDGQYLNVSVGKEIKLKMKWTNRVYECKKSGLSFVSDGPVVRNVSQGRR